jgi:hypothetical protein
MAAAVLLWGPRLDPLWNPFVPLDASAEPNFLTRYKLARLTTDPVQCQAVLSQTSMKFTLLPDETTGEACGFANAVRVSRTTADIGSAFPLSCRAAVSLALWERHALQPAAEAHFGSTVARIEHFGSYSCRNVYGRPAATRSRHATAEAWDVAGFVLSDGRRIRVLGDWNGDDPNAVFLRDVRNGACRYFDTVLSPDYNAAHADHLHLDRGPSSICR